MSDYTYTTIKGKKYRRLEGTEMTSSPEDMHKLNQAFHEYQRGKISAQEYFKIRDAIPGTLQKIENNDRL